MGYKQFLMEVDKRKTVLENTSEILWETDLYKNTVIYKACSGLFITFCKLLSYIRDLLTYCKLLKTLKLMGPYKQVQNIEL